MKNILVPTDFSDNADKALGHAVELAKKTTGKIHLLHTYTTTAHAGHLSNIDRVVRVERKKEMKAYLDSKTNPEIESGMVRNGEAVEMIEREVATQSSDLVVMGTQGANSISKKILGSTTSNVIKSVDTPILAIPANVENMDFDTLIVALDALNLPTSEVLDFMIDFVQTLGLKINVIHVSNEKLNTELNSDIKAYFAKNNIDYSYDKVESEEILDGILDFASQKEKAMLCLISRQRSWFSNLFHSSVSQKVAMKTTMPLLVLHDKDAE